MTLVAAAAGEVHAEAVARKRRTAQARKGATVSLRQSHAEIAGVFPKRVPAMLPEQ